MEEGEYFAIETFGSTGASPLHALKFFPAQMMDKICQDTSS